MMRGILVGAVVAALLLPAAYAAGLERVNVTEKGSVLIFPKVELRWNNAGDTLLQDTFISITNDYSRDVSVLMYFVSETCVWVDNDILLTRNEPAWWSAYSGQPKGVSPFTVLGDPYDDPEDPGPNPELVLRGFIVAFAYDDPDTPDQVEGEICWNHLTGEATIVNYAQGFAWEYHAYAFAAMECAEGRALGTPGELHFDGVEFDYAFDRLLLDFIATGSEAFSNQGGPQTVTHDTDLTMLIVDLDLTQGGLPPITKARFSIWNEDEVSFSGMTYCVTKWEQVLLSTLGGHFLVENLHTDKGKAWIDGVDGDAECCAPGEDCTDYHALLGVAAKFLDLDGDGKADLVAGDHLVGTGTEETTLYYDAPEPPQPSVVDTGVQKVVPGSNDATGLRP